MSYDVIMGQDLMQELGIDVLNSSRTVKWDYQEISQHPHSITVAEMMQINKDPPDIQSETKRISDILDAQCEAADLEEVTKEIPNISQSDRQEIFKLLKRYEILFSGELGRWKGPPISLHLKDNAVPYYGKPYNFQKYMKQLLKLKLHA